MNPAPRPHRSFGPDPSAAPEGGDEGGTGLVGSSEAIERVRRSLIRIAPLDVTVFLTGEAGSGKKEVARALHRASPRGHLPLVIVECGADSGLDLESPRMGPGYEGLSALLGSSQIGTLFLGAIDEAPLPVQRKLLEALGGSGSASAPHASVQVRILTGAGANHAERVVQGHFLKALSERLALLEIAVPPLRDRLADIPELVRHLVERLSRKLARPAPVIDPEVESTLMAYSWPGNVRQLRKVLGQALVLLEARVLRKEDLPDFPSVERFRVVENLRKARQEFERQHVERVLLRYGGDKQKAAEALGVDVTTIYRKLARPLTG